MSLSGNIGVEIDLGEIEFSGKKRRFDSMLFSESNTRFLVEVRKEDASKLVQTFDDLPISRIGRTVNEAYMRIHAGERKLVDLPLSVLRKKWLRKVS